MDIRWHAVADEGEPTENGRYFLTVIDCNDAEIVDECYWNKEAGYFVRDIYDSYGDIDGESVFLMRDGAGSQDRWSSHDVVHPVGEVIAWMPYPTEPYKKYRG